MPCAPAMSAKLGLCSTEPSWRMRAGSPLGQRRSRGAIVAPAGSPRIESERHPVSAQHLPQIVAARRPLLTNDAIHHVMRPVRDSPRAQRFLHLRIQPLLRVIHPLTIQKSIRPSAVHPLQRRQLCKGSSRVVPIHSQQQHPAGMPMQLVSPFQECHTVHAWQPEIGGDQRHVLAAACQLLQRRQPC
jgi:hypothetical protein